MGIELQIQRESCNTVFSSSRKAKRRSVLLNGVLEKDLAATYSRGTYRTTTIGNAVFDGRVREGIGSGHSFMATKKLSGKW